ncbi:MAG: hypothetical protein A2Z81_07805 [Omnitrophica WOR_2 bacterium GWA2_45_18]|nr:MAG: hypothetical protein A2Z81_07805 [Omnitrophica WOR_2 bacterium GWA2_45_18]
MPNKRNTKTRMIFSAFADHRREGAGRDLFLIKSAARWLAKARVWKWLFVLMVSININIFNISSVLGAGLSIPTGSKIDVNTGTLDVAGNVTILGTLETSTGTVKLTGNWDNAAGTYTANAGTVDLTAGSGTQTFNSGGIAVGKLFYNLKHSGAGTAQLITNSANIDNDFTNLAGTFNANGQNMTTAGDWSNSATFTAGSNTVTLDGTGQNITGSTTFYNLTKTPAATDSLIFEHSGEQVIEGALTLQGANGTNLLTLNSSDDDATPSQFGITLKPGGTQALQYLAVKNSDASGVNVGISGITLVAGSTSTDLGNNTNWVFGATTLTWDGDVNTDWDTPGNWNLGFVPGPMDSVTIPSAPANQPSLTAIAGAGVTVDNLTIQAGASLTLAGKNLTVNTALDSQGTIYLFGSETITVNTFTDIGIFYFTGDGVVASTAFTIPNLPYENVVINDPAPSDTFTLGAHLTITENLTVTESSLDIAAYTLTVGGNILINGASATLSAASGNMDVNGNVSLTAGTLTAPGSGKSFTIAQNFTHTAGTFTHSSGTVTLDSSATATLTGDTTFYNLASTTAGKTIQFTAGSNQTVDNTLTMTGTSANKIVLKSTTDGTQWDLTFPNGQQSVQYLNVRDSDANTNNVTCFTCVDSTGNDNADPAPHWIFLALAILVPEAGKTTDTTPTIIGLAEASSAIVIKDQDGVTVATVNSDANGNFRVEVADADAIDTGANSLTPYMGVLSGAVVNITVSSAPGTSQQPNITSHADGQRVHGAMPTIAGKGLSGATVEVKASDAAGNLLLTGVGSGTVNSSGNYSVTLSTALPKSTNSLSVTVDGVASDILNVKMTDPFGVVFDSTTDNLIKEAVVTIYRASDNQPATVADGDLDVEDVNPVITGEDGFYSFITSNNNFYITVDAAGYDYPSALTTFPDGRTIVTGSKGETFTVAGVVIEMDHPVDPNGMVLRIEKDANKSEVRVGEVVTYTVSVENQIENNIMDVYIKDIIPPGFKYLKNRVTLDGVPIVEPIGDRPLLFGIGNVLAGEKKILKYQLVVGAGVTHGDYNNTAVAQYYRGKLLSNRATETVKVVMDPLFDLGTVIGKVFFDTNENGIQDKPEYVHLDRETIIEEPVANARIVMEDGTVVTADKNGQFSIPALMPGRHVLRLDESTLPAGSYLTTDKAVVIDVTPGLMVKVNFGVNLGGGLALSEDQQYFMKKVSVTQKKETPKPRLNTSVFGNDIAVSDEVFVDQAEFRIFTNYASFIDSWKFRILDKDTKKVVRSFEGNSFNIFDPILWDGKDQTGKHVRMDRHYEYIVHVEDKKGRFDVTQPKPLAFKIIQNETELKSYEEDKKTRIKEFSRWVREEMGQNTLLTQTIPVTGETVVIEQVNADIKNVRVVKDGNLITEIPLSQTPGQPLVIPLEGRLEDASEKMPVDIILPQGDYEIVVQEQEISPEPGTDAVPETTAGEQPVAVGLPSAIQDEKMTRTHVKPIKVGEDYFFFVAMGDAKMGYNLTQGNIEPATPDDKYKEGFWSEGKMAYYLKGKIKGKYILTSSFDSDRDKKELFKNLDKDKYYPVYGDASQKNYDATDTQGPLYLMLEWDKSSVQWGNYAVAFEETEFAKFSRTLYGGKVAFESMSATKFGDARSKAVVFHARAKQKSAHNEFLATGGSLYYLKHKDAIEGSDKVKIEVRDKITGLVVSQRDMKEGADYEMDYENGRILFWRSVPMLVESYSIISSELLDGNLVYVLVDYEYDVKDKVDQANEGVRVRQAVTDHVLVGGTYVKESQEASNYELRGTDVTVRLAPEAKIVTEYAETTSESQGSFVSTDGGVSFTELATADDAQGRAYGIKGDARLFNRLGLASYYKWIENDFSTSATTAQQGKELIGFEAVVDFTEATRLTARHDIQSLVEDGNLQTRLQLGATKTATTLLQIVHEFRKLKLTGEYRKQEVTERIDTFESATNTTEDIVATRADYQLTEKVAVSVEQQHSIKEEGARQTTLGITAKPTDKMTIGAQKTVGEKGVASSVDLKVDTDGILSLTGEYAVKRERDGTLEATEKTSSTVGATAKVDEDTEVRTSVGSTDMFGVARTTSLAFGGTSKADEKTENTTDFVLTDSPLDGRSKTFTFGTTKKISEELKLATSQSFGSSLAKQTTGNAYGLIREKDGRKLEGTLTRAYSEGKDEVSRSNIFGLSGDINDRWAVTGSLERGDVHSHDGTVADRSALAMGVGYARKDPETGDVFKSSSKLEARFDEGDTDKRQILLYNATEGKVTDEVTLFSKVELSKTKNLTTEAVEAEYKEMVVGGAYRPIMHDQLNLIGRYTYQESKSPAGQIDQSSVEEEKAHVFSAEGIYDINEHWQAVEKFAYRIGEEKVTGFDFNKTHTWLIIHRLNYKIDKDWLIGGELRALTQREARDTKRGFLVEAARRIGEYAQLGVGYNFTDFNDDLTELDYTIHGPFVRMTGTLYDRTPEEIQRAREKWLNEKVTRWAHAMVSEELARDNSPILAELNDYFALAQKAREDGRLEEAKQIYKDIIIAGEMMFNEAEEYIQGQINTEEHLKEMSVLADQYFKNGDYEKAKKILEKIMEVAQKRVLE